jgi:hypothetical protein
MSAYDLKSIELSGASCWHNRPATVGKGAIAGQFGRLLRHCCSVAAKCNFSATRSDVRAPDANNEAQQLLVQLVRPLSHRSAALAAAIDQADNTPPEWGQGTTGYGRRFGSDFGIAAVSTTVSAKACFPGWARP